MAIEVTYPVGHTIARINPTYDTLEAYVIYEDGNKEAINPKSDLDFYVLNETGEYDSVDYFNNYYPGENTVAHFKAVYKNDVGLESEFDVCYGDYCQLRFDCKLEDTEPFFLYYLAGEKIKLPAYPYELPIESVFDGWQDIYGHIYQEGEEIDVTSSMYFGARILGSDFDITFDAGEGSGTMNKKTVFYGGSFYLPKPAFTAPNGYVFDYWMIEDTILEANVAYTYTWKNDVVAVAKYRLKEAATFIISYDGNGATPEVKSTIVSENHEYTLPSSAIFNTPAGYRFDHWEVKIGDNEPISKNPSETIIITGDTIVKAIWVENIPITLTSITLSGDYQTTFDEGDTFTSEGLVVTAHYEGKEDTVVEDYDVDTSEVDMDKEGKYTVTVSYKENEVTVEATYVIEVIAKGSSSEETSSEETSSEKESSEQQSSETTSSEQMSSEETSSLDSSSSTSESPSKGGGGCSASIGGSSSIIFILGFAGLFFAIRQLVRSKKE